MGENRDKLLASFEERFQPEVEAVLATDLDGLDADVCDHLCRFFRRYCADGDLLSKQVSRSGVYVIPHESAGAARPGTRVIHKDLGGLLRRELDLYIKNEVVRLDDLEYETAPRVEQYFSKIKVLRRIAGNIITVIAELEKFQKTLWLKKKLVMDTSWCIRIGCIPEGFYPEIAANAAQRAEWMTLCAVDVPAEDPTFLQAHPTLTMDTRHFDADITARLLEALGDLDGQTDGVLFHGENFQALSLMRARYRGQVKCIYIDPPYNKGGDGDFAYRDNYPRSSWLALIADRLRCAADILRDDGVLFASIDDHEVRTLARAIEKSARFAGLRLVPAITNLKGNYDAEGFVSTHEYVVAATIGPLATIGELPVDEDVLASKWREDEHGFWKQGDGLRRTGADAARHRRPNGWFPVFIREEPLSLYVTDDDRPLSLDDEALWPVNDDGDELSWTWSKSKIRREAHNLLIKGGRGARSIYKKQRASIGDIPTRKPKSFLYAPEYSSTTAGNLLNDVMGDRFRALTPKSVRLLEDLAILGSAPGDWVCDFYAGSGTFAHAAIDLMRRGVPRRFILVEMGDHFDSVLLPRLKKIVYSPDWKDGRPTRPAAPEEAERSPRLLKVVRLESYEDTFDNLKPRHTGERRSLLDEPAFVDPTAYRLTTKRSGFDALHEVSADLVETFNWLIGLAVQHLAAPRTFRAAFKRGSEPGVSNGAPGRLLLDGPLEEDAAGRWWFRTVTGITPDGRKALVIWRKRPGGETAEGVEQDNLILDAWFTARGDSSGANEFALVYVNGDNHLERLKAPGDTWQVRRIEEDFHRLMFETHDPGVIG
jgi:adenine-specific DNA-methyltransferase